MIEARGKFTGPRDCRENHNSPQSAQRTQSTERNFGIVGLQSRIRG
jgi:hypothetical protein